MKFPIKRTSAQYKEVKPRPCDEAYIERTEPVTVYNHRMLNPTPTDWHESGRNHRVHEEPYLGLYDIKEDDTPVWMIELSTLEELLALHDKYGEIVLTDGQIEIYDSYRE